MRIHSALPLDAPAATRIAWMNVTNMDFVKSHLFQHPEPNWAASWSLLHLARGADLLPFCQFTLLTL
jgi:hypothetical protein